MSKIVKAKWSGHCHYCGVKLIHPDLGGPNAASVEHIVPKSLGGPKSRTNTVMACRRCNGTRGNGPSPCGCKKCTMAWYIYFLKQNLVITDTRPGHEVYRTSFMEAQ